MMKELYFIGSLPWWLIALVALATIALLLQQFLSLKQRLSLAQSAFLVALRAVVYGVYEYSTCYQNDRGAAARRGVLLDAAATSASIVAAIRAVGKDLADAEAEEPARWLEAVQECIADMPPVAI